MLGIRRGVPSSFILCTPHSRRICAPMPYERKSIRPRSGPWLARAVPPNWASNWSPFSPQFKNTTTPLPSEATRARLASRLIRKLQGGAEVPFSCEISLIAATLQSTERAWSRPPISIKFQIQMFQASGLQIEYLKVLERKLGYDANKWVKYRTTGGQYQCRI